MCEEYALPSLSILNALQNAFWTSQVASYIRKTHSCPEVTQLTTKPAYGKIILVSVFTYMMDVFFVDVPRPLKR